MNKRIEEINDDTTVEVFNDYHSGVSYKLDRIERTWDKGSVKKVKMGELYEAVNKKGSRFLLDQNILLIKDAAVREALGLRALNKYSVNLDQITKMLKEGEDKDLEDILMYCSETTLSKILQKAIDLPIDNMTKASLIRSYSGIDVISIVQEKKESQIEKPEKEESGEDAPVRRRRVTHE